MSCHLIHSCDEERTKLKGMKNLICQCIYVPAFTPGLEIWVMTETSRAQIQRTEMSFLHNVARLCLRDRVRSLDV